ncbi:MAG: N-acetylmuramoyl-L-alanine amidase, partial [Clostridia bacterium]|nr:N-acetylmuramoyl-L-alanine amidase [Clostridia bacterium]
DAIENRDKNQTKRIIFHHSAEKFNSTNIEDCKEEIQRIQIEHFERDFADIGYHYIIDPFGRIWEGRSIQYKGSHATSYNHDIGVLVLGDFEPRALNFWSPNELNNYQKNAMIQISKWLCYAHDLAFIATGTKIAPISMHYIVNDTDCPGDNMITWINESLQPTIVAWRT